MRKLVVSAIALAASAAVAAVVMAGPEVQVLNPGKLPPLVECLDANGNVVGLVPNPIYEIPGDADTSSGC